MEDELDLLQLLRAGKFDEAQRCIIHKNVNLNKFEDSVLGVTLAKSESRMTLFLLACGAIPRVEDYSACTDASLQRTVAFFAKAITEGWSRYSAQTVLSRVFSRSNETDPYFCIDSAIQQVKLLSSSAAMKYGQKQSPEDSIRAWITKATPEGFFLRPLSGNLTPSGIKLIQACHNGDETSLVQQLLSIKQEEYHRIRYAPGGWCLLEEAMMKGWSKVESHLRSYDARPVGVDLANAAIETQGYCDIELVCHDDKAPLYAHQWLLRARCPCLASEMEPQNGTSSYENSLIDQVFEYCNASDAADAPRIPSTQRQTYQLDMKRIILKSILEYCYLDFITHDTLQKISNENLMGALTEVALTYDLAAIARASVFRRRLLPFPHFFKDPQHQQLILALHKRNEDGGKLTKTPTFFPPVANTLRSSFNFDNFPRCPTVGLTRGFLDAGASKILVAENKGILVHEALLRARCRFFESMLDSGMKESTSTSIRMNDISFDSLRSLVSFLYTDRLESTVDIAAALELVSVGAMLQLPLLSEAAKKVILSDAIIEESFVLRLSRYAKDSQDDALLKRCGDWFAKESQALTRLAQQEPAEFFANIDDQLFSMILSCLPQEDREITARNIAMCRAQL